VQGRTDEAIKEFKEVLGIKPDDKEAQAMLELLKSR
jgi:hypothetical protein